MARAIVIFLVVCALALLNSFADTAVVEKTFLIRETTHRMLCKERRAVTINGMLPGPRIETRQGDTVIVHVLNQSPYNITIHWHGVYQLMSGWADGPNMVTQCPIRPGNNYTYKYNIIGQEGTLWYHAHVSFLRATLHGALVIRPRIGSRGYPFPKPEKEIPIVLGEWWNANVVDVEAQALLLGTGPNLSDAYTINGKPGNLYPCSDKQMFKVGVKHGKTYLLRVINAALNTQFFFKIAGHSFKVVGVDATYTTPYYTDVLVIAPGQTIDALLVADAAPAVYHMAAQAYSSSLAPYSKTTTTGILRYHTSSPAAANAQPIMPLLPQANDTKTAADFYTKITALVTPHGPKVPQKVDEKMFIAYGMALLPCDNPNNVSCASGIPGFKLAASMNNVSFRTPTRMSLLEAHAKNVDGVFTADFPNRPPVEYNYTSPNVTMNMNLLTTVTGTRLKRFKYNSTVEMVLQNTALLGRENHPIHLHGYNFFVVGQGMGNYDPAVAEPSFNLVNPVVRNTIAVLAGGWAVIRLVTNNPGVWIMHCHLDSHLPIGLATAFVVENGPTPALSLPPPPTDYPTC